MADRAFVVAILCLGLLLGSHAAQDSTPGTCTAEGSR